MSTKNLKKLIAGFILLSAVILIQNQAGVVLASPTALTDSNSNSPTDNSSSTGNEGFGTGGPEVIAKLLSNEETDGSGPAENNNMTSNSMEDTNVFHTKELDVAKHTLRVGETSDAITGTIVNISPVEVNYVSINAALFDINNNLIGTVSGSVDFSTLNPGEDTSFKVDITPDLKGTLDHYMLFVLGTPKADD